MGRGGEGERGRERVRGRKSAEEVQLFYLHVFCCQETSYSTVPPVGGWGHTKPYNKQARFNNSRC